MVNFDSSVNSNTSYSYDYSDIRSYIIFVLTE